MFVYKVQGLYANAESCTSWHSEQADFFAHALDCLHWQSSHEKSRHFRRDAV
jgi:hypothetical protein